MTITKIVTASVLCSLSGIALLNAIGKLSDSGDRSDSAQDSVQNEGRTEQTAKRTIAKPELLPNVPVKPPATSKTQPETRAATERISVTPPLSQVRRLPVLPGYTIAPPETILTTASSEFDDLEELPTGQPIRDIEGHWAQYYIESLITKRIVQGFPDSRFRPDRPITPGEFAIMTQKAFPAGASVSYADLRSRSPNRTATRAEAVALIYQELARTEAAPIVTSVRVRGAVARPGAYSLAAMSNEHLKQMDKLPTLTRAIQQAGGSLETANLQQVEIRRLTETGATKTIKVKVGQSRSSGEMPLEAVLQQDDEVIIPAIAPTAQRSDELQTVSGEQ